MVGKFDFPFQQLNKRDGKKLDKDSLKVLTNHYNIALCGIRDEKLPCFFGGKGLGAWVGSQHEVAKDTGKEHVNFTGLIALGYPFEGYKGKEGDTTNHFNEVDSPFLIVSGEKDKAAKTFAKSATAMKSNFHLHFIEGADKHLLPYNDKEAITAVNKPPTNVLDHDNYIEEEKGTETKFHLTDQIIKK